MPYYSFTCQEYNINYDNILLNPISGKKQKYDVKNQSHDFLKNYQCFAWKNHQKKTNSDFSDKLVEELQEIKSILTIFFNENVDNFTKIRRLIFFIKFLFFPKNKFRRNIIII